MYWKTPDVGHVKTDRIFDSNHNAGCVYEFIYNNKGMKYEELKDLAIKFFNKESNPKYFGQIVTYMNFLGLIQISRIHNEEIVELNSLLEKVFLEYNNGNKELGNDYINYFLCKWQFPMVNVNDNREDDISKPYVIILKILLELRERNIKESYLTMYDFCRLFNSNAIKFEDIDDDFIEDIVKKRNTKTISEDKIVRTTSYFSALLKNSNILTTSGVDFGDPDDFMIGLLNNEVCIDSANYIVNKYEEIKFEFDRKIGSSDKELISNWAKYINNEQDFGNWRREVRLIKNIRSFREYCLEKGYSYSTDLIRRFILSLETKQFLILTGISGSGKTKIAELWGSYNEERLLLKAVGSNWNDNKNLLGYKNLLVDDAKSYVKTEIVEFIEESAKNTDKQYILILDEMNLSHVERYFSDFLSAIESMDKGITLPSGKILKLNENLKIIGTVNIDETTYMFSPKVLDRANVIEMNGTIPSVFIEEMVRNKKQVFLPLVDKPWFERYVNILDSIYDSLNGNFGYRVIEEVTRYVLINTELFGNEIFIRCLDEQIYQKILPKLHGTKAILGPRLEKIYLSLHDDFKLTKNKLQTMIKEAEKGYTSFIGE